MKAVFDKKSLVGHKDQPGQFLVHQTFLDIIRQDVEREAFRIQPLSDYILKESGACLLPICPFYYFTPEHFLRTFRRFIEVEILIPLTLKEDTTTLCKRYQINESDLMRRAIVQFITDLNQNSDQNSRHMLI